jgi:hypothetical protein
MKTQNNLFKLLFVFTSIIFLAGNFSCSKKDKLFTFNIDTESSFTISTSVAANIPVDIPTPGVTTNSTQQFQNNNTNVNLVKDIRLKSLDLTITNPAGKTFAFLQSIHIYISTNASNEIELAYADNISSAASTLSLTTSVERLDDYVKASSYNLRTKIVTKQVQTQNIDIKNNCKFTVTANL